MLITDKMACGCLLIASCRWGIEPRYTFRPHMTRHSLRSQTILSVPTPKSGCSFTSFRKGVLTNTLDTTPRYTARGFGLYIILQNDIKLAVNAGYSE